MATTADVEPGRDGGPAGGLAARTEDGFSQFVTFHLGGECFAFPMESVLEIIRVPSTVSVPLTPTALVGLANLRGTVLPVVDLRRTLALTDRSYDDATRVVVVDCGQPVGLVVDRVARVMNVEPDNIETAQSVRETVRVDLLTGVVKNVDGHDLIQLLDAPKLVSLQFETMAKAAAADAGVDAGIGATGPLTSGSATRTTPSSSSASWSTARSTPSPSTRWTRSSGCRSRSPTCRTPSRTCSA